MRGATSYTGGSGSNTIFQSTHLMRGATFRSPHNVRSSRHFNPRTSCEVRRKEACDEARYNYISIHAPHARCDFHFGNILVSVKISIHAPHARCDGTQTISLEGYFDFNPRTSCEVRQYARVFLFLQVQFQSTHLMRGATLLTTSARQTDLFQSTHLMRGATGIGIDFFNKYHISIHAPHARCDCWLKRAAEELAYFNPRTSCEVRPRSPRNVRSGRHFNPRTSCEVRLLVKKSSRRISLFQSTHLMRGATSQSSQRS